MKNSTIPGMKRGGGLWNEPFLASSFPQAPRQLFEKTEAIYSALLFLAATLTC
jgi:hypothetical protein